MPGQYFDPESGNNHNGFRDYNPTITRYVESDPSGLYGGMNTYQYAFENPGQYIDPWGLDPGNNPCTNGSILCGSGPVCGVICHLLNPSLPDDPDPNDGCDTVCQFLNPDNNGDQLAQEDVVPEEEIPGEDMPDQSPGNINPPLPNYPTDPTQSPGPGFEWSGKPGSTPGDGNGNWYNSNTRESLRPDLNHEPGVDPHYDYRAPDGRWYRWFPDGRMEPKFKITT